MAVADADEGARVDAPTQTIVLKLELPELPVTDRLVGAVQPHGAAASVGAVAEAGRVVGAGVGSRVRVQSGCIGPRKRR